jgi:hypothetical protein
MRRLAQRLRHTCALIPSIHDRHVCADEAEGLTGNSKAAVTRDEDESAVFRFTAFVG